MPRHTCHATGCPVEVPPQMFMCKPHWRKVPAAIRRRIWAAYRPGQEIKKSPSAEWLQAADEAIAAVTAKEKNGGARRAKAIKG